MANWDNKTFDAEATKLAASFWAGAGQNGASLTDLVAKTAKDHCLNPEQITRLARIANSKAFEAKFAAMKADPDRVVEFPLAEPRDVIAALSKEAAPASVAKTAAEAYAPLADEMAAARGPTVNYFDGPGRREKTASAEPAPRAPKPEAEFLRHAKVARELDVRVKEAELAWEGAMASLAHATKRVTWDHGRFEKDALAVLGAECLPEINALRALRKTAKLEVASEKVAALLDRVVGRETAETRLLKAAVDARTAYQERVAARAQVGRKLAALRQAIGHGR